MGTEYSAAAGLAPGLHIRDGTAAEKAAGQPRPASLLRVGGSGALPPDRDRKCMQAGRGGAGLARPLIRLVYTMEAAAESRTSSYCCSSSSLARVGGRSPDGMKLLAPPSR